MEKQFFEKPATYVGEVNINVTNLDKALSFYQEVIGFEVLEQSDQKAVLTADGRTPLLTLVQPADAMPKEGRTTGLFHFAILLPSRADLSSFIKHAARAGARLGASDHLVSEALYLNDPDGNGIEVYRDRPSNEWEWSDGQVAMSTEPLDADSLVAESDKEWNGLPAGTVMGHIHLHVANLQNTKTFYIDGLGFEVVTNYPGALFTSTADYHHHIGLNIWNGENVPAPSENSAGLNWYSLVFPDEQTREEKVKNLENQGVTVQKETNDYIVKDPSGNKIHMQLAD
ncbi:catechol 2,3-dioxygenase [Lentibacillus persicus]|uniref:Catechol 2,3-dioxygenase n=1 Tax=Lentibacillus persicus TaxID=640948 RepID=A0A1I1YE26_9BACI|nr:VOC family protein [Lentibacillus persicus]SFE17659.1 catechol 2,3-dioxygenase [Lentibacillus persicus]